MDTNSALQKAIEEDSESCVLRLLQTGVNLKENSLGTDLLLLAVQKGSCERIIGHLLNFGAKANFQVLVSAIRNYDEVVIEKLLNHGADANETGSYNENALHSATRCKSVDKSKVCEILIKHGAAVNHPSMICRIPPLFNSVDDYKPGSNFYNVIEVLLQYGAQPLLEFDAPRGRGCPLQYIFYLPQPVIENIVKYASLQVNHDDDKCISEFLAHFRGSKSIDPKSRPYFNFATKCLEEVEILKQRVMPKMGVEDHESKSTLFDFVVSQGSILSNFLSNPNFVNHVFFLLSTKAFPIYSEVIFKKFERIAIVNKVTEISCQKWSAESQGRKVYIDSYCIEYICKCLEHKDLRSLFLAFASPQ